MGGGVLPQYIRQNAWQIAFLKSKGYNNVSNLQTKKEKKKKKARIFKKDEH